MVFSNTVLTDLPTTHERSLPFCRLAEVTSTLTYYVRGRSRNYIFGRAICARTKALALKKTGGT